MLMQRQDMSVRRRFKEMDAWFQARGLLLRRQLGRAEILWIPHVQAAHNALVAELVKNPFLLLNRPRFSRASRQSRLDCLAAPTVEPKIRFGFRDGGPALENRSARGRWP